MQRRHNALLQVFALLITGVQFAASQSAATVTVPTIATSITSFESIITSTSEGTEQGGPRAGSATTQEDETILSTITEESTISISTETVLVTTVSDNTVYITTSGGVENAPTESAIASTSAAAAGDASTLASTASATPDDDSSKSGNRGLSAGAKAGIAVGSILGAALLAGIAYFCLKARSERRPRSNTLGPDRQSTAGDNTSTLAASEKQPEGQKNDSSPEQMTSPAYAANRLSDHMNLTGIVYEDKDESPMYIGVPSHLNGGKRWSGQALDRP